MRTIYTLAVFALAALVGGCATGNKPRCARQAPKPVTSAKVLDAVDAPDAEVDPTDTLPPERVVLAPQYEPQWQVIGGRGRWVFVKVADQPPSPNLQPGLLPQELGMVTAESMRLNKELAASLNQLTADAMRTKIELAKAAKERTDALIRAKQERGDEQPAPAPVEGAAAKNSPSK